MAWHRYFAGHDAARSASAISDIPPAALQNYGGIGVELFFAISGILICTRILEEEVKTGKVQLKSFFIRRLLRIQPAALTYLAVIGLLLSTGVLHQSWSHWFGAFHV